MMFMLAFVEEWKIKLLLILLGKLLNADDTSISVSGVVINGCQRRNIRKPVPTLSAEVLIGIGREKGGNND